MDQPPASPLDFEALSAGLTQTSGSQDCVGRVVYKSRSMMSPLEHSELLVQAHRNNRRLGLTGLLVIQGQHIVQVLEGPHESLDPTMNKIKADFRHREVELTEVRSNVPRLFPNWAMGSVVLSESGLAALIAEVEAATDEERRHLATLIRDGLSSAR